VDYGTVLANFPSHVPAQAPPVVIELIEDGVTRVPDRLQSSDVHLAIVPAAADG
jgi:hypothetical protein